MGYVDRAALGAHRLDQQVVMPDSHTKTLGLGEAASVAYAETKGTEVISSASRGRIKHWQPQQEEIHSMRDQGLIPDATWNKHQKRKQRRTVTDWIGLSEDVNAANGTEFDFSEEAVNNSIAEDSLARKAALENTSIGGTLGSFLGTMGAVATDPVEVATAFIPGGQYKTGATLFKTFTSAFARDAAVGLVTETALQANVYAFKNSVGLEYNLSDAAANVVAVMTLGGSIGGSIAVGKSVVGNYKVKALSDAADAAVMKLEREVGAEGPIVWQPVTLPKDPVEPKGPPTPMTEPRKKTTTPDADLKAGRIEVIKAELRALKATKLSRGAIKTLKAEAVTLQREYEALKVKGMTDAATPVEKPKAKKHQSARRAKAKAKDKAVRAAFDDAGGKMAEIRGRLNDVEAKIDGNAKAAEAEADLTRLEQGSVPDRFMAEVHEIVSELDFSTPAGAKPITYKGAFAPEQNHKLELVKALEEARTEAAFYKSLPPNISVKDANLKYAAATRPLPVENRVVSPKTTEVVADTVSTPIGRTGDGIENVPTKFDLDAKIIRLNDEGVESVTTMRQIIEAEDAKLELYDQRAADMLACVRG